MWRSVGSVSMKQPLQGLIRATGLQLWVWSKNLIMAMSLTPQAYKKTIYEVAAGKIYPMECYASHRYLQRHYHRTMLELARRPCQIMNTSVLIPKKTRGLSRLEKLLSVSTGARLTMECHKISLTTTSTLFLTHKWLSWETDMTRTLTKAIKVFSLSVSIWMEVSRNFRIYISWKLMILIPVLLPTRNKDKCLTSNSTKLISMLPISKIINFTRQIFKTTMK